MEAPSMQVSCTVDNCKFNQNHMCHARSLKVDALGGHHANTSDATCCSTFIDNH